MGEFERKYYEDDQFWAGNMVQDEANTKRIELTASFVKNDVNSLLDVGCGNGVFLHYISKMRPSIYLAGTDRSESALKFVKCNKVKADIQELPFDSNSFDCVTCLEVIEHLPVSAYPKALDELARISKNYIIVSVPYNEILEDSYTKCPSCKSIFNYELHLRSFDDEKMHSLFLPYGFKCISTVTTGTGIHFRGHKTFRKIFYAEQFLKWNSPICPICGYSDARSAFKLEDENQHAVLPRKRKFISYISSLPKLFWPKERKDYWIIALYQKHN